MVAKGKICDFFDTHTNSEGQTSTVAKLRIQRNFVTAKVYSVSTNGHSSGSSNGGGTSSGSATPHFQLVATIVGARKVHTLRRTVSSFSTEVVIAPDELEQVTSWAAGWYAICASYTYVLESQPKMVCSLCSLQKFCKVAKPSPTGEAQSSLEAANSLKRCDRDNHTVQFLPDREFRSTSAVLTFSMGEFPIPHVRLAVKVSPFHFCKFEPAVVTWQQELAVLGSSFLVVNVTDLNVNEMYEIEFRLNGSVKIQNVETKLDCGTTVKYIRMPTVKQCAQSAENADRVAEFHWPVPKAEGEPEKREA